MKKAMCDHGSRISFMPISVAIACGIHGDLKPTRISIQLANKSVVKPKSIIKNVLVRVGKFIIPVDFIVVDIEKDRDIPLIFGRLFLAMGDVMIGVMERTVTFCVNGEEVMFDARSASRT